MKLKNLAIATVLAVSAGVASAATYDIDLGVASGGGTYSKGFEALLTTAGAFEDTFNFTPSTTGWTAGSLITINNNSHDVVQFEGATLNGIPFSFNSVGNGTFGFTPSEFFSGNLVMRVWGIASPSLAAGTAIAAAYSGTVTVSAVPEPETYAMMLAGLGVFGFIARRNKKAKQEEESLPELTTA